MSQPASNPKEPSKFKKLISGMTDNSGTTRLTRRIGSPAPIPAASSPEADSKYQYRFLPAFWTVTGILSLAVNGVLLSVLLIALQMLGAIQLTANDKTSSLIGGLYTNFVKMDEATISTNIPVTADIPLNIVVPVQTSTRIRLSEDVTIPAHVVIHTGGVDIDADAVVTLYADPVNHTVPTIRSLTELPRPTTLPITLDFPLTVQSSIPISLNVPVNIPLSQTQLHEPFVGLQQVVKPLYCLVEPNALVNNIQICSPLITP
jgi:hypothetical protein